MLKLNKNDEMNLWTSETKSIHKFFHNFTTTLLRGNSWAMKLKTYYFIHTNHELSRSKIMAKL